MVTDPGTQFTRSQRVFLSLLEADPARRYLSPKAIVQLTPYSQQVWSKALRTNNFAQHLLTSGLYLPFFNDTQRALLQICADKKNWGQSPKELLYSIGITSDGIKAWRNAFADDDFAIELCKTGYPTWLSNRQRLLYKALSDPANHTRSSLELAHIVGLAGIGSFINIKKEKHFQWFIENETGVCLWMTDLQRITYHFLISPEGRRLYMTEGDAAVDAWLGKPGHLVRSLMKQERIRNKLRTHRIHPELPPPAQLILYSLEVEDHNLFQVKEIAAATGLHESTVIRHLGDANLAALLANYCDFHTWMTQGQRRIYALLRRENPANVEAIKALLVCHGISLATWYKAFADARFAEHCKVLDIRKSLAHESILRHTDETPHRTVPPHHSVTFIDDEIARLEYVNREKCWDMRKLFANYPRHVAPSDFIVDFRIIRNLGLRDETMQYIKARLPQNSPTTFSRELRHIARFANLISQHYPEIRSFSQVTNKLVKDALQDVMGDRPVRRALGQMRDVFYMLEQEGLSIDNTSLEQGSLPYHSRCNPRPASIDVMQAVDNYLQKVLIPRLENVDIQECQADDSYDAFIILRYTGVRPITLLHMLASGDQRTLQLDASGAPLLYIPKEYAKTKVDAHVPLEHLNNASSFGNPVVRAILRQTRRVNNRPVAPDGKPYLFRQQSAAGQPEDVPKGSWLRCAVKKVAAEAGAGITPFTLLPIILRHTLVTELGEAGIHIERIAQFVSHESIASTEFYFGVGKHGRAAPKGIQLESLGGLALTNAPVSSSPDKLDDAKRSLMAVHDYPDSVCQHPIHTTLCCALPCLLCPRKEITPDKLQEVEDLIRENQINLENAQRFSLREKIERYRQIINFHVAAREILRTGQTFRASAHFYPEGHSCHDAKPEP